MSDELAKAKATDFDSIPIADLANIDDPKGFYDVAENLIGTAEKVDFFYVSNHGIPMELIESAFKASKGFLLCRKK